MWQNKSYQRRQFACIAVFMSLANNIKKKNSKYKIKYERLDIKKLKKIQKTKLVHHRVKSSENI